MSHVFIIDICFKLSFELSFVKGLDRKYNYETDFILASNLYRIVLGNVKLDNFETKISFGIGFVYRVGTALEHLQQIIIM